MHTYWTIDELKETVKNSKTIREVLRHFGLPGNQGHYNRVFHKAVKEFDIDISHIVDNFMNRSFQKFLPSEEFFVAGKFREGQALKKRLIKEGLVIDRCSTCGQKPEWNNSPLVLQLDHISGDNTDNRIENLRLLCPNCHSQTETWSGRNSKGKHASKHICKACGDYKKNTRSDKCVNCENTARKQNTKIIWPEPTTVLQMSIDKGLSATGRALGVSDNTVRKFLKRNKLI